MNDLMCLFVYGWIMVALSAIGLVANDIATKKGFSTRLRTRVYFYLYSMTLFVGAAIILLVGILT